MHQIDISLGTLFTHQPYLHAPDKPPFPIYLFPSKPCPHDDGGSDDDDDDDGGGDDDADDGGGGGDDDVEARDGPGAPVSSAAQLGRHWQDIQPSQKDSEKFNIVKYLFHQLKRASAPIGMIFAKKKSPFHLNYLGTIQPTRVPKEHLVTLFTKKNKSERESKPIWLRIRDQQECTTTK